MNLSLNLNGATFKKLAPTARRAQPYVFGVVLIGVFAYTAWVVNAALNVQPAATAPATATSAAPKISFDKKTIDSVKSLTAVSGAVPSPSLGKNDPFGN